MNISLAAEPLFYLGSFPITNTLIMAWLIIIFLSLLAGAVSFKLKSIPRRLQSVIEMLFEAVLSLMESVTEDKKQARKFFPIVATIFLFVLLSNWLEVVPGLGTVGLWQVHQGETILVPFIRSASADLNFTLALAIISVFTVQLFGIMALGAFKYAGKFINFKNPVYFFVGILELFAELAKIVSFSFRLFGNIFAGEVLLMVMLFLVPYVVPLPFLFLEIFVGLVQALIFSMLTLVFLKMAVTHHD